MKWDCNDWTCIIDLMARWVCSVVWLHNHHPRIDLFRQCLLPIVYNNRPLMCHWFFNKSFAFIYEKISLSPLNETSARSCRHLIVALSYTLIWLIKLFRSYRLCLLLLLLSDRIQCFGYFVRLQTFDHDNGDDDDHFPWSWLVRWVNN